MRNPELTRETILETAGELFNTRGYKATSISHITQATGYTKGAIYKHFVSKDDLERETFSHLADKVKNELGRRIRQEGNAMDKLDVIFRFFESHLTHPLVQGGCPLMNLAIESDDAHPVLRKEARSMMAMLRETLIRILENGKRYGQLKPGTDAARLTSVILASLEGGIMMSKLTGSPEDMAFVQDHLRELVNGIRT